jgi:hypothetical protein
MTKKSRFREAIDIKFHPNNLNREVGFPLSGSWKPYVYSLKERKKKFLFKNNYFILK